LTKRLVIMGGDISSYKDKYGLILKRTSETSYDIKELPNESHFYQRMLFQGILTEWKRIGVSLNHCDVCNKDFKTVGQWYVHMRREHKNG